MTAESDFPEEVPNPEDKASGARSRTPPAPKPAAPASARPVPNADYAAEYELGDTGLEDREDQRPAPAANGKPAAPVNKPEGHTHSALLVEMARDFGMSDAEIAADSTPELERHLQLLRRLGRQTQTASAAPSVPPPGATGREGASPADGAAEAKIPGWDLTPEQEVEIYGEGTIEPIKKVFTGLTRTIADLQARVEQLTRVEQTRQQESIGETLDRLFGETPDRFGAGDRRTIEPGSAEYTRRAAVCNVMASMAAAPGTHEQKFRRAVALIYGDQPAPQQPEPAERRPLPPRGDAGRFVKPEDWDAGGLARPANRQPAAEPPGDRKAVATAAKYLRSLGGGDDSPDPADDAFPT